MRVFNLLFHCVFVVTASNPLTIDTQIRVQDQLGNPLPAAYVSVDNQDNDGATADENGLAQFTITSYPTGIFDQKKIEDLLIFPNPARDHVTVRIDEPNGVVGAYNVLGQRLGEASVASGKGFSFPSTNRVAIIRYTSEDGKTWSSKLLMEGEQPINLTIQSNYDHTSTKSAMQDNHHFMLHATPDNNYQFVVIDGEELLIPVGSTSYQSTITRNATPRIISSYNGETFDTDTLKIALNNLRYTDDDDHPTISQGASIATIKNGNLLVFGSGNVQLTYNDGENTPVNSPTMQFTKNEPKSIVGKTIVIGKVAEAGNYDLTDPEYIAKRIQGGMTFFLTNNDGSFYQEITSDAQGNFQATIPNTQSIFYGITPNEKTHEALIKLVTDSLVNHEIIAAANNTGANAMSANDNMQLHMKYLGTPNGIEAPSVGEAKTTNWKSQYLEVGGIEHVILDKIYDYSINQFTDDITQELKDTLLHTRENVDQYVNKFFSNGNTRWASDFTGVTNPGRTTSYWFRGDYAAGSIGREIRNGLLVRVAIGINADYFGDGTESVLLALNQEQMSVKTRAELLYPEKPNTLDGGGSGIPQINNNAITSVEWYQARSQALAREGAELKGFWGWDIDQRVMEEAKTNPYVQQFFTNFATKEAQDEFQKYVNGEKSATVPEHAYELIQFYEDKAPEIIRFTKENYQEQLKQHDIKGIDKESIEAMFNN